MNQCLGHISGIHNQLERYHPPAQAFIIQESYTLMNLENIYSVWKICIFQIKVC